MYRGDSVGCYLNNAKARFSEVGWAAENEFLARIAAAGDAERAQLCCVLTRGRAQWDRRHAAWWLV
jgi:hypothetical protein